LSEIADQQGHSFIVKGDVFKSVLDRVHRFIIGAKLVLATLVFVVAVVHVLLIDLTVAFDVAQEVWISSLGILIVLVTQM